MTDENTRTEESGDRVILHGKVLEDIRNMILSGELEEGRRVPEGLLCERLNISRTPLREALKALAVEGFVALRPNRGAVVVPIDVDETAALFELKGSIERLIGELLPGRIESHEVQHIETIHRGMHEHLDASGYTQANHTFHASLAAAVRNDALVQTYSGLQQKIMRARLAINERPTAVARSLGEHEQIMIMVRARAPRDLAHELESHNRRTGEAILDQLASERGGKRKTDTSPR